MAKAEGFRGALGDLVKAYADTETPEYLAIELLRASGIMIATLSEEPEYGMMAFIMNNIEDGNREAAEHVERQSGALLRMPAAGRA